MTEHHGDDGDVSLPQAEPAHPEPRDGEPVPPVGSAPVDPHARPAAPNLSKSGEPAPASDDLTPPEQLSDTDGSDVAAVDPAESVPAESVPAESRRQRRKRLKAARPKRKAPWWELPALVVVAIGIAILVKSFVVQPFYIPSDSMEQTLHGCPGCHGDRILVNKPIFSVIRDPEPGDIVVFDAPSGWSDGPPSTPPSNVVLRAIRGFGQLVGVVPPDGQVLVKRVIATGGQTVKGDAQGHVMISTKGADGPYRTLSEPYVYAPKSEAANLVPFGPVTVPKGRLWVMGDHRTDSADSRFHCTPGGPEGTANDSNCDPKASTVPVDNVIGKAFVIAWPPSRWTTLGTPSTFASAAAAVGPGLPATASALTVLPVLVVRRRRRNRD